jgi:hypothetical protein
LGGIREWSQYGDGEENSASACNRYHVALIIINSHISGHIASHAGCDKCIEEFNRISKRGELSADSGTAGKVTKVDFL